MRIVVLTPVRLFGDGLSAYVGGRSDMSVVAVIADLASVREILSTAAAEVVLVDVTQGTGLFDVRGIAAEWPQVALVALGLDEQRHEVIQCGRLGFAGYVNRRSSIEAMCQSLAEIVGGRQACPPEISGCLLRALFRHDSQGDRRAIEAPLTRREGEVLELLGRGLSNKEIGDELSLSVATVKHHVHNLLEKLQLGRRTQAMRLVRDSPWLGRPAKVAAGRK